ncbi:MAG: hypothetical protein CMP55_05200 [Flavobacteriales bacterium]|mgnify:FL=1|jgi:hypothetical protein|nr:hypothetical protein [Flavobacteriales bacterium]
MNYLFQHPKQVCMTYFSHFWFSMSLSLKLAIGSIKAFIHAIYPDKYITSSSDVTKEIMEDIESSGCKTD